MAAAKMIMPTLSRILCASVAFALCALAGCSTRGRFDAGVAGSSSGGRTAWSVQNDLNRDWVMGLKTEIRTGAVAIGLGGEKEGSSLKIYNAFGYTEAFFDAFSKMAGWACLSSEDSAGVQRTQESQPDENGTVPPRDAPAGGPRPALDDERWSGLVWPVQKEQLLNVVKILEARGSWRLDSVQASGVSLSDVLSLSSEIASSVANCQQDQLPVHQLAQLLQDGKFSWLRHLTDKARTKLVRSVRDELFGGRHTLLLALPNSARPLSQEAHDLFTGLSSESLHRKWELNFAPAWSLQDFEERITRVNQLITGDPETESSEYNPAHIWVSYDPGSVSQGDVGNFLWGLRFFLFFEALRLDTGILNSPHNALLYMPQSKTERSSYYDFELRRLNSRGVTRLQAGRFQASGDDGVEVQLDGLELRTGVRSRAKRHMVLSSVLARLATNDWTSQVSAAPIHFFPTSASTAGLMAPDWTVDLEDVQRCLGAFAGSTEDSISGPVSLPELTPAGKPLDRSLVQGLVPFFDWSRFRVIHPELREVLFASQRQFMGRCAQVSGRRDVEILMSSWLKASRMPQKFWDYLSPAPPDLRSDHELRSQWASSETNFDPEQVDLGFAVRADFPVGPLKSAGAEAPLAQGQTSDFEPGASARLAQLKTIAASVQLALAGAGAEMKGGMLTQPEWNEQGEMVLARHSFLDQNRRNLSVEWVGMPPFAPNGTEHVGLSPEWSGGHISVTAQHHNMRAHELRSLFRALEDAGALPEPEVGSVGFSILPGVFDAQPSALARLVQFFETHRGVFEILFQSQRTASSSRAVAKDGLLPALQTFLKREGNRSGLEALLYKKRYYNRSEKRWAHESQIDLTRWFSAEVPADRKAALVNGMPVQKSSARFLPLQGNRRVRLRFFDAPRSAHEAALQIRFVRSLLALSLARDGQLPLKAGLDDADALAREPATLLGEWRDIAAALRLDPKPYEWLLWRNLVRKELN